ncbi:MAG: type 1 glutamine amidotransferase [Pseudonocardia sp.]
MKPVAIVVHHGRTDTRWTEALLAARGVPAVLLGPYAGELLPAPTALAGVVCLGGPQDAHGDDREPYLAAEEDFLAAALAAGRPVLGICLGAQLLANVVGGAAIPGGDGLECGEIEVTVAAGIDDRVLAGRSGTYFSYHRDSFRLPPGAELLATSDRYPQAFRLGIALGIQFHPEISPEGVAALAAFQHDVLVAAGVDPEEMVARAHRNRETAWRSADTLIGGWIDHDVRPRATLEPDTPGGPR